MKQGNYVFTSESVSDGHPDKVADQISDALVDAGLKKGDDTTRVAVETLVTTNLVTLAGEVKNFNVSKEEVEQIVRDKVKEIGYEQDGFHWDKLIIDQLECDLAKFQSLNLISLEQLLHYNHQD